MSSISSTSPWNLAPLLLPWGLILGGILFTLFQSFDLFNPLAGHPGGGAYRIVLTNPVFWRSLGFTFTIALISSSLATGSGFLLACWFSRLPQKWQKATLVYKIFLILPHISVAYLVILFFSQTGILSSLLFQLGVLRDYREFPILIFDNRGVGLILGYMIKETPFVLLLTGALLGQIPQDTINTARMLGAKWPMIVRRIFLPQALPAMVSSFFILFLYTFGAFEIPFLLGGSRPVMLSVSLYDLLFRKDFSHRSEGMVILVVMFLVNVMAVILFLQIRKSWRRR